MERSKQLTEAAAGRAKGRGPRGRIATAITAIVLAAVAAGCVHVAPSSGVNPAGEPLQATGVGFEKTLPVGIYVAFGPDPKTLPADWYANASYFQTAVWVWANGSGSTTSKKMNPDGTFHFTLTRADGSPITAVYTDGNGETVDCTTVQCGVVTMKAHGSTDRSADSFAPVSFAAP